MNIDMIMIKMMKQLIGVKEKAACNTETLIPYDLLVPLLLHVYIL